MQDKVVRAIAYESACLRVRCESEDRGQAVLQGGGRELTPRNNRGWRHKDYKGVRVRFFHLGKGRIEILRASRRHRGELNAHFLGDRCYRL